MRCFVRLLIPVLAALFATCCAFADRWNDDQRTDFVDQHFHFGVEHVRLMTVLQKDNGGGRFLDQGVVLSHEQDEWANYQRGEYKGWLGDFVKLVDELMVQIAEGKLDDFFAATLDVCVPVSGVVFHAYMVLSGLYDGYENMVGVFAILQDLWLNNCADDYIKTMIKEGVDPDNDWDLWSRVSEGYPFTDPELAHKFCQDTYNRYKLLDASLQPESDQFGAAVLAALSGDVRIGITPDYYSLYSPCQMTFDGTQSTGKGGAAISTCAWTLDGQIASHAFSFTTTIWSVSSTPHTIALDVVDVDGNHLSGTRTFSVGPPPIYIGSIDRDNLIVDFNTPANPLITNYTWNFGDGSQPVTGAGLTHTPQHQYTLLKPYTVTLTERTQHGNDVTSQFPFEFNVTHTDVSGTLSGSRTWGPSGSPYHLLGQVVIAEGTRLTLLPGTVVQGTPGSSLLVRGELVSQGQFYGSRRTYFTSVSDMSALGGADDGQIGDWGGIVLNPKSSAVLTGCTVRYAGTALSGAVGNLYGATLDRNGTGLALNTQGATVNVSSCTFSNNSNAGASGSNGASASFRNNTFTGNPAAALSLSGCSAPAVNGNTFKGNGVALNLAQCTQLAGFSGNSFKDGTSWAAKLTNCSGDLSFNNTTGSGNAKGLLLDGCQTPSTALHASPAFPSVVIGHALTATGLTIDPSVVVKFQNGAEIDVSGSLSAQGGTQSPIYFTSVNDHSVGGNSGTGAPAVGDWASVKVLAPGSATFSNCFVRYAQAGVVGAGGVSATGCVFDRNGLGLDLTGAVNATGCTFSNSNVGAKVANSGAATFTGDQFTYNQMGLALIGCTTPVVNSDGFSWNGVGLSLSRCQAAGFNGDEFGASTIWAAQLTGCTGDVNFSGTTGLGNAKGLLLDGCQSTSVTLHATPAFPSIVVNQSLSISGSLTVEPGVVVKLSGSSTAYPYATISTSGPLIASATKDDPINFTSVNDNSVGGVTGTGTPMVGDWAAIAVDGNISASFCTFRWSGSGLQSTAISGDSSVLSCLFENDGGLLVDSWWLNQSALSLYVNDCTFNHSGAYVRNCNLPTISGNTFAQSSLWDATGALAVWRCRYPVVDDNYFAGNQLALSFLSCALCGINGNSFVDNGGSDQYSYYPCAELGDCYGDLSFNRTTGYGNTYGLGLYGCTVTWPTTLRVSSALPNIIVSHGLAIPATLTIEPGVVVKIDNVDNIPPTDYPDVDVSGALVVRGTIQSPVYFTSLNDDSVGGKTGTGVPPLEGDDWSGLTVSGSAVLSGCVVRYAASGLMGSGNVTAQGCVFEHDGIGLDLTGSVQVTGCSFRNDYRGAYAAIAPGANFTRNMFMGIKGLALGLEVCSSSTVTGNVFQGNGDGLSLDLCDGAQVVFNTLADITGAAVALSGTTGDVANNILAFNGTGLLADAQPTLSHNCVYGNQKDYDGIEAGTTDLRVDPLFANRAAGDIHLTLASPCIDAGDDTLWQSGMKDIDGEDRRMGGHVDIGADEVPALRVSGYVIFEDWNHALPSSLTFEYRQPGQTTPFATVDAKLDSQGGFVVPAPQSVFDLSAKQSHWLRRTLPIDVSGGSVSNVSFDLVNGDADGNNNIGIGDLSRLLSNWGGADPDADIDGNGSIGFGDLSIVLSNYGAHGDR